jgi:uncharacterized protein
MERTSTTGSYCPKTTVGAANVGLHPASERNTRGEIADHIGRKSPDIGHPLNVLEDAQLITYEAVIRKEWTRLERGDPAGAWRDSQATFLTQVVGPHFEALCREWAMFYGSDLFGQWPGAVAAGVVNDPGNRTQIQVDVAVLSSEDPDEPRRVLSLGEVKWGAVMTVGHLDKLRRARDLLAVKGYRTEDAKLTCYSGAGFDENLRAEARRDSRVQFVDLDALYGSS